MPDWRGRDEEEGVRVGSVSHRKLERSARQQGLSPGRFLRASGTSPHTGTSDISCRVIHSSPGLGVAEALCRSSCWVCIQIWKERLPFERSGQNEGAGKSFKSTLSQRIKFKKSVILLNTLSSSSVQ